MKKKHFYTPCVGLSVYMRSSHNTITGFRYFHFLNTFTGYRYFHFSQYYHRIQVLSIS
jgi:hypothetical protein